MKNIISNNELSQSERLSVRDIFSAELDEIIKEFPEIVVLNADTAKSCGVDKFIEEYPDRAVQVGIAEQNMMLVAAGLATTGKIPIVTTFAIFTCLRACEQIRTSVAYPMANVKIIVSHCGITSAEDGVTHQCTEDLAIMRAIPNMTVVAPADAYSAMILLRESLKVDRPVYLRYSRAKTAQVYKKDTPLSLGDAVILREGKDLTFFACGFLVYRTLQAAELLEKEGLSIGVVDVHTIKPLDEKTILQEIGKTGAAVCVEDHSILGGLGSAVAELLSLRNPVPLERLGIKDEFTESGNYEMLLDKYGMGLDELCQAARRTIEKKTKKVG